MFRSGDNTLIFVLLRTIYTYKLITIKRICISFLTILLIGTPFIQAEKLIIATYNIRYQSQSDSLEGNGWAQRCPIVCKQVKFYDFEVFGAQEVLHAQLLDMQEQLNEYSYVGVGRTDGKEKGEYAPIFYKKQQFKLLDSGNFWMSEITDKPNKGWDAALPRICTWAKLQDKCSDFTFFFFNLHMDHIGVEARKNSTLLVLHKIKELCADYPVILTGDFNTDQNNANYETIVNSKLLKDTFYEAEIQYALNGTFNDFKPDMKTESRIDHIFVSPEFKVSRYGILTDTYRTKPLEYETVNSANFPKEVSLNKSVARTPSDHFPVMAIVEF